MDTTLLRHKLLTVLTEYDRKESTKRFHNPHMLAIGCNALQNAMRGIEKGVPAREVLIGSFCGPLLDKMLKAAGEPKHTREESMGRVVRVEY